ncbi:unnamed protein product, partial [Iphiclides podalirius]
MSSIIANVSSVPLDGSPINNTVRSITGPIMPIDGDVFTDAKHGALFVKPSYIIKEASRPASLKHINHNNLMRSEPFSRGAPKEFFPRRGRKGICAPSALTRND